MIHPPRFLRADPANVLRSPAPGSEPRPTRGSRPLFAAALSLLVAITLSLGGALAPEAGAQEQPAPKPVSKSYRKIVRDLLEMSGAQMAGEQVAYSVAQETLGAIASTGTEITEEIQKIVLEDALKEFGGTFGDIDYLTDLYAPIYADQLTESEVSALRDFYRSPAGQKALAALPAIAQAAMYSLQQASLEKVPGFQAQVDARLREAGVIVVPE